MDSIDATDFVITNGPSQVYHLRALNEVERQRWVTALELAKAKAIKNLESGVCVGGGGECVVVYVGGGGESVGVWEGEGRVWLCMWEGEGEVERGDDAYFAE